ncbi:hypothetical protein BC938DRAFT_472749 [Jimgerdemannia flammicorona]|uniref:Uncharacterized protein n=1 Tax=Jimgerdemannia flammicorona TaxID=994334 RepID=A0A433QTV2_9FUNG|nr:hypothetical protein BC938DRAFT_472749 [Jimgerdemannia flammicorona]
MWHSTPSPLSRVLGGPSTTCVEEQYIVRGRCEEYAFCGIPHKQNPENGVWCCWLPECKKQINVANYNDNEVGAAMVEHIKE